MDKREQIEELLERHDLTLHYGEIFGRWTLGIKNADGKFVWRKKGTDLVRLRDDVLEYLQTL